MILSDTGSSRINGYLFVLERSLATVLPRESVRDVVREIDSHLRDRISAAQAVPDERMMLEKILAGTRAASARRAGVLGRAHGR